MAVDGEKYRRFVVVMGLDSERLTEEISEVTGTLHFRDEVEWLSRVEAVKQAADRISQACSLVLDG